MDDLKVIRDPDAHSVIGWCVALASPPTEGPTHVGVLSVQSMRRDQRLVIQLTERYGGVGLVQPIGDACGEQIAGDSLLLTRLLINPEGALLLDSPTTEPSQLVTDLLHRVRAMPPQTIVNLRWNEAAGWVIRPGEAPIASATSLASPTLAPKTLQLYMIRCPCCNDTPAFGFASPRNQPSPPTTLLGMIRAERSFHPELAARLMRAPTTSIERITYRLVKLKVEVGSTPCVQPVVDHQSADSINRFLSDHWGWTGPWTEFTIRYCRVHGLGLFYKPS